MGNCKVKVALTVHGSKDVADLRRSACTNYKVGACTFIYVDTVVAVVSHRKPYEARRPDFVGCTTVRTVFKSTIDRLADRSFIIPICEVFRELKHVPA